MSSTGKLAGKVALVTGGSRGLGRGIAEGFAAEGANIVVNYLKDEKSANAVVEAIKKHGTDAIAIRANIGEVDDVTRMIEAADQKVRHHRRSGQQCRYAQFPQARRHVGGDLGRYDQGASARHVPMHALYHSAHAQAKSGKVINMSGTFGVTGGAEFTHMSAAKAGMIGFTRALAREVGHDGINVNCIAPAIIRTDLYNFMPEDVRDSIVGGYPLGRVGEVEDVVATALFLATKDGDYFTGQTLCPAGGDVMV